ncbi:hypothetical protein GCM10023082_23330 [Streptomyces tremellae]|uniref:Uncharacterized protein n=1 Tax=Streptomyces tremellae TaxID=1124239 RepID=A0ABP7EUN0_9ACTN
MSVTSPRPPGGRGSRHPVRAIASGGAPPDVVWGRSASYGRHSADSDNAASTRAGRRGPVSRDGAYARAAAVRLPAPVTRRHMGIRVLWMKCFNARCACLDRCEERHLRSL